ETEPHARGQIQTVIAGIPGKETTRADSEIIQTIPYGVANVRGRALSQAFADGNEIAARNDQQTISPDLRFAQVVQLGRIRGRIVEVVAVQDCFDGHDIARRGSGSVEQENGSLGRRAVFGATDPTGGKGS